MCPPRFRREGRYGEGVYFTTLAGQTDARGAVRYSHRGKSNQKEQVRIKTESLRKYFPRNYSAQQMEREIMKLLEARYRAKNREER